jgi:hypothetical protein
MVEDVADSLPKVDMYCYTLGFIIQQALKMALVDIYPFIVINLRVEEAIIA